MLDRFFFPLIAALAVAMVALAAVWPQGLGDRSPGPFGHPPVQQTAAVQAAMKREHEAAQARLKAAREAVAGIRTEPISPAK